MVISAWVIAPVYSTFSWKIQLRCIHPLRWCEQSKFFVFFSVTKSWVSWISSFYSNSLCIYSGCHSNVVSQCEFHSRRGRSSPQFKWELHCTQNVRQLPADRQAGEMDDVLSDKISPSCVCGWHRKFFAHMWKTTMCCVTQSDNNIFHRHHVDHESIKVSAVSVTLGQSPPKVSCSTERKKSLKKSTRKRMGTFVRWRRSRTENQFSRQLAWNINSPRSGKSNRQQGSAVATEVALNQGKKK